MAERDEFAVFCQLVTGFFSEFPQCDLFDCFRRAFVGVVDLA